MLSNWLVMPLMLIAEAWSVRRDGQIRFLKLQLQLYRGKLPSNRVILSPEERQRLLRLGQRVLEHEGILPDPDRRAPKGVNTPWRLFVWAHLNTAVACDFFCKTI